VTHVSGPGSERLDLVVLTPALDDLIAGRPEAAGAVVGASFPDWWPDEHDGRFLRYRKEQLQRDPDASEWLVRAIVDRAMRTVVGHAGFHGPPGVNALGEAGAVELGYTVFPDFRRRGYASEAVAALMRWARRERHVHVFVASVAPDNEPSLAIVRKLGFEHIGEHWDDEDGRELEFRLEA
jgi:ribosomal-protein-alanine N-acetyltransferase